MFPVQNPYTAPSLRDDRVYRAPDRDGGLPTYYVRPNRIRDPGGGFHTVQFKRGPVRMPNMINGPVAGVRQGPKGGAFRLFHAVSSVTMQPVLQAPWDRAAEQAYGEFPAIVIRELDQKVVRKAEGKRY